MKSFYPDESNIPPHLPNVQPMRDVGHEDAIDDNMGGYPTLIVDRLQHLIDARNVHSSAALLLIAIDNMPMMISGFGHKSTEEAMSALLRSLKTHLGYDDDHMILSRVQKDQIAVILYNQDTAHFTETSQSIARHIKGFGYESSYGFMHVLASVASVTLPRSRVEANDIFNQAYIAVKSDKSVHSCEFEPIPTTNTSSRQEMNMVNYITRAIKDEQFRMAFQPIVTSATGQVEHYEALLRLVKPSGEVTTAGPLIPVAERMGLIDIIDEMVLDKIVEEMLDSPELKLSFNVSNLTANSTSWLRKFTAMAKQYPEIVSRMMVEITETAVHLDLRRTAYFVAAVQAHGATVALDDFGSGYTSFRQLKSLSVDIIKIDGIFVKDLTENHDNLLFIKTMLDFTNGFGLETVAEFVENGETAKILMDLGVHYMQGYYFGFPDVKRPWKT